MRCASDANFWLDLYEGSLIGRAFALDDTWLATDVVLNEIEEEGRLSIAVLSGHGIRSVSLTGEQLDKIVFLGLAYPAPSPEDLSALVLAKEERIILVTGDGALRDAAEKEGVEVHGTLWVLDRMIGAAVITPAEAADSLRAMVASDRRLPKGEVTKRLRAWGPDEKTVE